MAELVHYRNPRFKIVGRFDAHLSLFRVCRICWESRSGKSTKLSLGVWPKLLGFSRGFEEWTVTLFCLRVHHIASFGGRFP